ncbi:MAG: hypothetical protein WBN89_07105 [Prochlorococcaceae cyanobacterium]
MAIDKSKLDLLYESYGFRIKSSTSDDIRVYTYRSGYFNNADIIPVSAGADAKKDFDSYQESGFACKIRNYDSLQDAEKELFEGFFSLKGTKARFREEDEKFRSRQEKVIGASYKFVDPPYRNTYGNDKHELSIKLIDRLMQDLNEDGPRLIILEAAAGYGKTCASFELLNKSLTSFPNRLPLFIELSRNRQAKIFRYVLLDEIDRVFPTLSADLVKSQICKGSLFLIVDGFDELLHRTEAASPDYDKVEPMLETLSDLLTGNAKIVLTSRKTAIFTGDHFHTWMESYQDQFHISRYSLLQPQLDDWLSYERRCALDQAAFPIEKISNPVLLAFLSGQEDENFYQLTSEPNKIVDYYFDRLLDREKERQELRMDPSEQYVLFTKLAGHMLEMDFTAEDHEYLQLFIAESNNSLLSSVRSRYSSETRPTADELTAKLVSHALLDRKGEDGVTVGFVNDFALGNFVAEYLLSATSTELVVAEDFLEQAVSSFRPRPEEKREALWKKLAFTLEFLPSESRITSEIMLGGRPLHDMRGETFNGIVFEGTSIGEITEVVECVFVDCSFSRTRLNLVNFRDITFVGCRFYECEYIAESDALDGNIFLVGCLGEVDKIYDLLESTAADEQISAQDDLERCKRSVLEQFWPVGRPHFWNRKQLLTLYRGHPNSERRLVSSAISQLQGDGLLAIRGDLAEINTSEIQRIREVLGR